MEIESVIIYGGILLVIYLLVELFRPRYGFVNDASLFESTRDALNHLDNFLDLLEEGKALSKPNKTFKIMILGQPIYYFTSDEECIQHILKDNFENYGKGCLNFNSQKENSFEK